MGLLESVAGAGSDAANSAAGQGSTLGGLVDDAAGKLVGGVAGKPNGTPYYYPREALNETLGQPQKLYFKPTAMGSEGKDENRGDRPLPIAFIHYGKNHRDMSDTFAGKGPPGHGLACRDALLRETILLFGFVAAAKHVMQTNTQGAIGQALETVGSLLGSGKTSGAVTPAQFAAIQATVQTVGDKLNTASIAYPALHQAGIDLHQARADFGVLCATAFNAEGGEGGGLPSLPIPGGMGPLAAVGGFIADIPKYLFKVQDSYKAMYQAARSQYESGIEDACRAFAVDAIKDGRSPSYRIWFEKDEEEKSDAPEAIAAPVPESKGGVLGEVDKKLDEAIAAKDKAVDTATRAQNFLINQLETAGASSRPGSAALSAAFATFSGGIRWDEPRTDPKNRHKIVPAPELLAAALGKGCGIDPLPGFVAEVIKEITKTSVLMLERIYTNLLMTEAQAEMRPMVLLSVRETLSRMLVDLPFKLLGQDVPTENKRSEEPSTLGSVSVDRKQLQNKGAELLRDFITKQAHHIDVIVDFIVDELSQQLEELHKSAQDKEAMTMETFLGAAPMLLALLVRNTLFPVFNLMLEAFGLGDTVGRTVWNPVRDKIKQAGEIAQEVKERKDNALSAAEQAKQSGQKIDDAVSKLGDNNFNFLNPLESLKTMNDKVHDVRNAGKDGLKDVVDTAMADPIAAAKAKTAAGDAPFSGVRVAEGEAVRPSKGDIEGVQKVVLSTEAA